MVLEEGWEWQRRKEEWEEKEKGFEKSWGSTRTIRASSS